MCARYTLRKPRLRDVAAALDAEFSTEDEPLYQPRFNAAPTDLGWVAVYRGDRRVLRPARWRYETAATRLLINIRSETIGVGRFGTAFAKLRCAVISDGFYEWPPAGGEPTWFHAAADKLLLLGGLLQLSATPGAVALFSVLTTRPNVVVAPVHNRMPVVLDDKRLDDWLASEPTVALQMVTPAPPDAVVATKVSNHVNKVRHDDPECIAPRGAAQQGSLF